jgi:tol-pal system protein YbgF
MASKQILSLERWVGWTAAASLVAVSGCAHQTTKDEAAQKVTKVDKLESRIEELERTNGRLSVRLEEMEDEVFLLQDRVEAHRLALRRRNVMEKDPSGDRRASAPQQPPRTNYGRTRQPQQGGRYQVRGNNAQRQYRQGRPQQGTSIPLSEQQARGTNTQPRRRPNSGATNGESSQGGTTGSAEGSGGAEEKIASDGRESGGSNSDSQGGSGEKEVVITADDFQRFASEMEGSGYSRTSKSGGKTSSGSGSQSGDAGSVKKDARAKRAQKRVTDERLETTDEKESAVSAKSGKTGSADKSSGPPSDKPFKGSSGLDLYKSALAKYRSGEYATALAGFEKFMAGGPRHDYQDNGLYWIGECHFGLADYDKAVRYFKRVLDEQPDGNKVPDAMLKMALAFRELGMPEKARGMLEKLTRRYPSTNAGRLGQKKLSDINS